MFQAIVFWRRMFRDLGIWCENIFPTQGFVCWRNFQWTQMFLLAQTLISRWLHPGTFNIDTQNGQDSNSRSIFPRPIILCGPETPLVNSGGVKKRGFPGSGFDVVNVFWGDRSLWNCWPSINWGSRLPLQNLTKMVVSVQHGPNATNHFFICL